VVSLLQAISENKKLEPPVTAYQWEGGRKRRPLTLFSASFPHPVQGVSPAALNALAAAPGRQVYRHSIFCRATRSKNRPLSFCSPRAHLGSLRILAASKILFKGRVRPLCVEDDSPQHPLNSKQKRFTASAVSRLSTSPTIIAAARCPLSPAIIVSRGP